MLTKSKETNRLASVFGQCSWNNLQGFSVSLDGILVKAGCLLHHPVISNSMKNGLLGPQGNRAYLSLLLQLCRDRHFRGSCTRYQSAVFGESLDCVDTVIHSSFYIVAEVLGATSYDDCGSLCLSSVYLQWSLVTRSQASNRMVKFSGIPCRKTVHRSLPISTTSTMSQCPTSSGSGRP